MTPRRGSRSFATPTCVAFIAASRQCRSVSRPVGQVFATPTCVAFIAAPSSRAPLAIRPAIFATPTCVAFIAAVAGRTGGPLEHGDLRHADVRGLHCGSTRRLPRAPGCVAFTAASQRGRVTVGRSSPRRRAWPSLRRWSWTGDDRGSSPRDFATPTCVAFIAAVLGGTPEGASTPRRRFATPTCVAFIAAWRPARCSECNRWWLGLRHADVRGLHCGGMALQVRASPDGRVALLRHADVRGLHCGGAVVSPEVGDRGSFATPTCVAFIAARASTARPSTLQALLRHADVRGLHCGGCRGRGVPLRSRTSPRRRAWPSLRPVDGARSVDQPCVHFATPTCVAFIAAVSVRGSSRSVSPASPRRRAWPSLRLEATGQRTPPAATRASPRRRAWPSLRPRPALSRVRSGRGSVFATPTCVAFIAATTVRRGMRTEPVGGSGFATPTCVAFIAAAANGGPSESPARLTTSPRRRAWPSLRRRCSGRRRHAQDRLRHADVRGLHCGEHRVVGHPVRFPVFATPTCVAFIAAGGRQQLAATVGSASPRRRAWPSLQQRLSSRPE